jgi:hypothetical protein
MPRAAISAVIAAMISTVLKTSPRRSPAGTAMPWRVPRATATAISPAER